MLPIKSGSNGGGGHMTDMYFGQALELLKQGFKLARKGWNGKGMFIQLQVPDAHSKMQQPYIYMSPVGGKLIPWTISQSDALAEDWYLIQEEN